LSAEVLTPDDIHRAERLIGRFLRPTPLLECPFLSDLTGATVLLKLENLQPTGSFKVRGALNRLATLSEDVLARGVVTSSAGNHGLGVALAAQILGVEGVTIFVPQSCPGAKLNKLRRFNVNVQQYGTTYEQAHQAAAAFAERTGATEISAYDDAQVIAGQATIASEIFAVIEAPDWLLVPVGGGGMIAGISFLTRHLRKRARVVGVQPEASPAALLSLRDGVAHDPYEHGPTIADGLAGGFGRLPLAIARDYIDRISLASEEELRLAIFRLLDEQKIVAEASGAISIVPLMRSEFEGAGQSLRGQTVVCVISGGNVATPLLRDIINAYATG
jgi:threonine dehydratase